MIVRVGVKAKNQYEVIKQVADLAYDAGYIDNKEAYLEALLMREREGTTGFGFGVAIPHGKCEAVKETGIVICKLQDAIPWRAIDDKPVELIIGIAVSLKHTHQEHLAMISKLARAVMKESFLETIKTSNDPDYINAKIMEVMR